MEKWIAGSVAVVSLLLPAGWVWFKHRFVPAQQLNQKQRWMDITAEFFYFVGLPYLALVFGLLTPQLLGLKGLEYFSLISIESFWPDLQMAFTLLLMECLVDIVPMLGIGIVAVLLFTGVVIILTRYGVQNFLPQPSALRIIYNTLHSAFYWAIFWLLTGNLYLGVVFGSGWLMLEYFFTARIQKKQIGGQPTVWIEGIVLIFTATIFYYYPNLWLLWLIHWALIFSAGVSYSWFKQPEHIENSYL